MFLISVLVFTSKGQDVKKETTVQSVLDLYQLSLDELLTLKVAAASKFEESVKDISQSIYIITKSDINTYGYRSLTEALQHVPGFYMVDDHSSYKENFGFRGFFRDEWNQNMVFLVNGVRQRSGESFNNVLAYINVPIQSIERIEVIKGASSVTYGSGAFLGVVNIVTIGNTDKTDAYITYGTQNTINTGVNIHKKIDDYHFTINSGVGRSDGINQNYYDMGLDTALMSGQFMQEQYGYAGFSVQNKIFNSSLTFDHNANHRPVISPPFISKNYEGRTDLLAIRYMLGAKHSFNEWLEVNGSYQYQFQQEEFRFDFLGLDNDQEQQKTSVYSNEFDLNVKTAFSDKLYSSIGGNVFYVAHLGNTIDVPLIGLADLILDVDKPMLLLGAYYRIGWQVNPKLNVKGGVRADKTNEYTVINRNNLGNQYLDPTQQVLDSFYVQKYQYPNYGVKLLPELALMYSINKEHYLKFIYGEAINRLPIFRIRNATEGIKPEYIRNIELNHIGQFSDKISLNSSIFFNHYYNLVSVEFYVKDNKQVQKANNSGELSTAGVETSLDYRPNSRLRFLASASMYHTMDNRHKDIYPAFSPKILCGLNMSYSLPFMSFSITSHFVSSTEPKYNFTLTDPGNINSAPKGRVGKSAPTYVNMGLNVRYTPAFLNNAYISMRCSNLLNQKMFYPVNDFNAWASKGTLGISRTILCSIGYSFK